MCKCKILIQVIKIHGDIQYFQPDYLISQINTSLPHSYHSSRLWSWFLIIAIEVSSPMFVLDSFMRLLAVSNCTNPAGCPYDPRKEITMRPSWPFIVCFAQMCKLDSVWMCVCEQQKAREREREKAQRLPAHGVCHHPLSSSSASGLSLANGKFTWNIAYRLSSGKSTT